MSQNNSNAVKSSEVGLIPFEVLDVVSEVREIPEGVKLINAPAVWEKSEKGKDIVRYWMSNRSCGFKGSYYWGGKLYY